MKKIIITFVALLTLATSCFAGDYAKLNFVGFSKDGRFLAFEEYGSQDGSGFPYSNYYFVDTEKNSFSGAPVQIIVEKETATEAQARNKAKLAAAKRLLSLKILSGNTGTHAVARSLNDLSLKEAEYGSGTETARFSSITASNYRRGDYELLLKPILTKTKECEPYAMDTYKFELTMRDHEEDTASVLQKDLELPKSRGCAIDYNIADVYLYNGHIAVFLNVFSPGFEGPDMRFMVVAGKFAGMTE